MNIHNMLSKYALLIALSFSSLAAAVDYSELITMPNGFNDALSIDSQGNIYVSHAGGFGSGLLGATIHKISTDGTITDMASSFNGPVSHDFDSGGNMYVVNYNSGIIDKITPEGVKSAFADFSNDGNANGILVNDNDEIFVTSYNSNAIFKVSASGDIEKWVFGNGLNGPVGIVTDENENIYVGNYEDGRIFKISTNKIFTEISSSTGGSGYITYASGMIYATGIKTHKIYQVPVNGGPTTELAGSSTVGFNAPNGITVSNDGSKLYVSNYSSNNKIIVIDNFIDDGSTNPQANNDIATVNQDSAVTIDILSRLCSLKMLLYCI
jgi:DNA-binding beta-propeller fold protein YncE